MKRAINASQRRNPQGNSGGTGEYPRERESTLLAAALHWLRDHGYLAWRMPVGPVVRGDRRTEIRFSRSPIKGFPDIACILKRQPGVLCAIECKVNNNQLSPEQTKWRIQLYQAGAAAFTLRHIDELPFAMEVIENGYGYAGTD